MKRKIKKKTETLSVCLIVKNEEQYLGDCLTSIQDVADQIIVVDTGSTDNTIAIAESFGAEVHHFTWCDDFAAARNESIKYATSEWILWIDADEQLIPESKHALKKLLVFERQPVLYKIRIRNLKEDGSSYVLSSAHRLFRNHMGIRFDGRIHEQISYSGKAVQAQERSSDVTLSHVGYSFSGEQKQKKQERNFNILSEMVTDEPDNAYAHLTLGHNLKESGQVCEAREQYEIALKLDQFDPSMKSTVLNSLADILIESNELPQAKDFILRSMKLSPIQNTAYYLRYRAANHTGDHDQAIQALVDLRIMIPKVRRQGSQVSTDIDVDLCRIHHSLGELYAKEGEWGLAKQSYEQTLSERPDDPDTLKRLVHTCHNMRDYQMASYYVKKLINLQSDNSEYLSTLAVLAIKQQKFDEAIDVYEKLRVMHPESQEVGRRLAGLYAKTGNLERMQQLL